MPIRVASEILAPSRAGFSTGEKITQCVHENREKRNARTPLACDGLRAERQNQSPGRHARSLRQPHTAAHGVPDQAT